MVSGLLLRHASLCGHPACVSSTFAYHVHTSAAWFVVWCVVTLIPISKREYLQMGKRKLVRLHVCAFTCIVIAGMVVSGCTRARSARPTLTHVKFLLDSKAAPTYAGFYIAKEKGIFADHSLDVEIVEGVDARTSTQTIGSGKEYAI